LAEDLHKFLLYFNWQWISANCTEHFRCEYNYSNLFIY
jgi:hypothetical protein